MTRMQLKLVAAAGVSALLLSACGGNPKAPPAGPAFAPFGDPFFDPAAAMQSGCTEAWDESHGGPGRRDVRGGAGRADAQYWDPETGRYRNFSDQFDRVREMNGPKYGVHNCIFEGQRTVVQDGG